MLKTRIIPCLLLKDNKLVKGVNFENHRYVGDPINAVKIFNAKEVDELILLDISATPQNRRMSLNYINQIVDECFMPLTVGGGIQKIEDIKAFLNLGVEKVTLNTATIRNPELIRKASSIFGNQAIIVSIDVKRKADGNYEVYTACGSTNTGIDPVAHAIHMEKMGAGELLITSIDQEGTREGFDLELIQKISNSVNIPVIASGGAGTLNDFYKAVHKANASAVAGGSIFVFHGKHKAVLISYPSKNDLIEAELFA